MSIFGYNNEAVVMVSTVLLVTSVGVYIYGLVMKGRPINLPHGVSQESMDQVKRERKGL